MVFSHQNSIICVVHVVNYNMSKFGFKILKLLNLKWKIASSITSFILIARHCTLVCTFRWTHTNFLIFHNIQIVTVIVQKCDVVFLLPCSFQLIDIH
jgi:hypothetical protein